MSRKTSRTKKTADRSRRRRFSVESLEQKVVLTAFGFAESGIEWAYSFEGDAAADGGDEATSLDGTWSHDNGSDAWDGTEIGTGNPGGVTALTDGDTNFVRVQDTGDPRDALGVEDPSNRKVYFTHTLASDFADGDAPDNLDTIVDDGVTLYFRARIATAATGVVDDLHADGGTGAEPWPENGLGYHQHNGGKSMIAIKQVDGANIAFGLDRSDNVNEDLLSDEEGNAREGLILPHLLQDTALSDSSDPPSSPETLSIPDTGNILPVEDITEWQEFWVTIEEGQTEVDDFLDGTHIVRVYSASSADPLEASQFGITGATGNDVDGESYIAIGAGGTPRAGAFDIDFFSWTPGVHEPAIQTTEPEPGVPGDIDGDGQVAFSDFLLLSNAFGSEVDPAGSGADLDGDGQVGFSDFLLLSNNFGKGTAAIDAAMANLAS